MGTGYFICHSSVDSDLARDAVAVVEEAGHTAWFAPREIPAGEPWPSHITKAIKASDIMMLIGTAAAFDSKQVERELSLADQRGRPILPVIVDGASSDSIDYYLGATHAIRTTRASLSTDLRKHFGLADETARYRFWNREVIALPDGGEFTIRRWGDGIGPSVLLLHGLGLTADDWDADAQVAAMDGRAATFIAPDLPQHTTWDHDPSTCLPDVAPRLAAMMSALGFERYGVVGHSLGGAIALHLAARDQRVLWCVAGGVGTEVWDAGPRQELAEMLRTGHARTESDEGLLDFLISRRHDLVRLATLCEGELSPTPDLARLASRVTVVATPDDRAQADALTQRASLAPALSLPGDHVSSWLSGEFLRLALDQHLPRSTSGSRSPGGPRPKMLLISGLPGSGKTTVASCVAERHGMELISRTAVRHDLASRPVYSLEEAKEVTVEIDRRANIAVEQGDSLVIEGTGLQPDVRDRLRTYATRARTAGFIAAAVWLEGERAIVRERLEARPLTKRLEGDMSEADVGIYDVMRSRARPGWLGNRCDVTDASAETVANWICDVLSGSVADLDAPAYFLSQAALAEAGRLPAGPARCLAVVGSARC